MGWGARLGSRWTLIIAALATVSVAGGVLATFAYQLYRTGGQVLSTPSDLLFVGMVLTILSPLVATAVVVLAMRKRDVIEEVFVVHRSGLLLVHFSKTLKADKDRDIVVAMLTALQSFVQEAFSHSATRSLRQMDFGNRKILIRQGAVSYLAVVLKGRPPLSLRLRMGHTVELLEDAYRGALSEWTGNADDLAGADDLIREGILAGGIRGLRQTLIALGTVGTSWLDWRRTRRASRAPPPAKGGADLQENAAGLLARPELQRLRPEYRDMMTTALHQIEEGRFTLVGVANVYMVLALQKVQRATMASWWNAVLQTMREVLRTWPWVPEGQAWVREGIPLPPTAAPGPTPVQDLLGKVPTLPLDFVPNGVPQRTTVGGALHRSRRSPPRGAAKVSDAPRRLSDD